MRFGPKKIWHDCCALLCTSNLPGINMKLCNVSIGFASFRAFLIAAMLLAAPWSANAAVVSYTDCIAGNPPAEAAAATCAGTANNVLLSVDGRALSRSLTYTHNINNDGFLVTDTILSATLLIDLNDDGGTGDPAEGVKIFIDFNGNNSFEDAEKVANNHAAATDFSCTGTCNTALLAALADGITAIKLAIGLSGGPNNDFYFSDSLLTVTAARQDELQAEGQDLTQVPEPATLALLALGLAGLRFASRRKQS
jgi:hypothetical protein